jgi:Ca-activated chloride channel family protein
VPGAEFATSWAGEDASGDFIAIAVPGAPPEKFIDYARTSAGNPATLTAPPAGAYEVRYISANGLKIRARAPLTVASEAELIAPAEAEAGTEITVSAPAGGDAADYVTIVAPDTDALALGPYARLRGAAEVTLAAPEAPGTYEVRLVHAATQTIRARALLTIRAPVKTAAPATKPPAPAARATTSEEAAPNREAAAPASEAPASANSEPAPVEAAAEPEPAAPAPRTARPSLMALIAVDHGAAFHVAFTGAGAPGDQIGLAPAGGGAGDLVATQAAVGGAPLAFDAPAEPGDYDILYVDASGEVLARRKLEVW